MSDVVNLIFSDELGSDYPWCIGYNLVCPTAMPNRLESLEMRHYRWRFESSAELIVRYPNEEVD